MNGNNKNFLPGMEEFFVHDEKDYFFEGKPGSTYFDATTLFDAPSYQRNANANQTYILHIAFPSYEELVRAIRALTGGDRKGISANAKEGTINGIAIRKNENINWLQFWEKALLGLKPEIPIEDPDAEPEIIPGEKYPEEDEEKKPKKKTKTAKVKVAKVKEKPVKKETQKKVIPVTEKFSIKTRVTDFDRVITAFPTYRRSNDVKTWKCFDEGTAIAFVEPQELHLYRALHPEQNLLVYHENGMTINQKRAFIVSHAIRTEHRWLFMLEDDLTGFFKREGKTKGGSHKLVKTDYETVMNSMLGFAEANGIAELGLSQQQSNHYYEEEYVKYSCKVTEFCLFDLDILRETGVNYDTTMPHFEDFDISIQLLMTGRKVGLFTPFAFGHVTMGTNKSGGFIDDGMEKRKKISEEAVTKMVAKYPDIVSFGEGRLFPEPKVNWRLLYDKIEV